MLIKYKKVIRPHLARCGYSNIDEVAKRYDDWFKSKSKFRYKLSNAEQDNLYFLSNMNVGFLDTLNAPVSLLDVGCGNGFYSELFTNKNFFKQEIRYEGCEVDKSIVRVCQKNYPKHIFFESFADKINRKSNTYDVVFCSGTIQYALNNWKESIIEMKRVARHYIFLVRFPVTKYHKSFYVNQRIDSDGKIENHNFIVLNRIELETYLNKIGLDVVSRDYSSEEYKIEGVDEKIILNQYLLEKLS